MRVTVVPLGGGEASADEVELLLRRRDAPPGLLLERMQDVDGGRQPDRVNGPEGIAVVARHHFQDAGTEALERLGVAVSEPDLGLVDREAHAVLHGLREAFQIRLARTDPFDWLQHGGVRPGL